jgi:hypothetical protein
MHNLRLFAKTLFKKWWTLMSCAVFTFLGLYSVVFQKSNAWIIGASIAAGLILFMWAAFLVWKEEHQKVLAYEQSPPITAESWKELAKQFQKFPPTYVRAEWMSESLDWEGKTVGEQWDIRDDWNRQFSPDCEVLCKLAGSMLLKSKSVSRTLSPMVKSRTDDAVRWLYFLKETRPTGFKKTGNGTSVVRGFKKNTEHGVIGELAPESARGCFECAAKEI